MEVRAAVRLVRRVTTALLILAALAMAAAVVLSVTKDWLVALGVRAGVAAYNARMNSRLMVQEVAFDLLTLTATARGISVVERGQTPPEAPISVTQVTAKVQVWPLIRRRVVLEAVAVAGVNVRLQVDRQNRVNLEGLFRLVKGDPDRPSPWNVTIHRFAVDQAAVNLAFDGQPVSASLDQLAFQGSFTVEPLHVHAEMLTGRGDVTYRFGQDQLRYDLSQTAAMVDVFKKRLVIDRLRVGAETFTVTGRGGIDDGQVAGQFAVDLDLATVAAFLPGTPQPVGSIVVRGTIDGPLDRPQLELATEGAHIGVGPYAAADLRAGLSLTGKRLHLERFVFGLAGGTVRGAGTLDLASEHLEVQVDLAELSLAGLEPLAAGAAALVDAHVDGHVRLASPSFSPAHMRVEGTLALSPRVSSRTGVPPRPLLPLPLTLHTRFHFDHRTLTLEQVAWALDGVRGKLTGTLAVDGTMRVAGEVAADLSAQTFVDLGLPSARGVAEVAFESQGQLRAPRLKGILQLHQAGYRDIPIEALRLELEADRSTVKIISLTGVQWGGRYQVTGTIDLSTPRSRLPGHVSAWPIRAVSGLRVRVEHMNLGELTPLLPGAVPLAGKLSLQGHGEGPWASLRGGGQIAVRGLMIGGEPLGDASLVLEGGAAHVLLKRLLVEMAGGQLLAHGSVALPWRLVDVTLAWQGVHLDQLVSLQGLRVPLSGGLNGTAKVRGEWPDLHAGVMVQGPRLAVSGLDVSDLQLQAMASPREILLERLTTRIAGARLNAGGRVSWHGPIDLRVSSEGIPLRGFAPWSDELPWNGRIQLDLTGSGTFDNPRLRGQIRLTGVQAGGIGLGSGRVTFGLDGRQMTFSTTGLRAFDLDGSVTLAASLPARLRLSLRSLDLGLLAGWFSGAPRGAIEGDVSGLVEVDGPLRALPAMTGRIVLGRLRMRSNGVEFQNTSPLRWQLTGGVLQFEAVHLQAQGANLDMRGSINLGQELLTITIAGTSPLAMVGTRIPGVRFQQGRVATQVSIHGALRDPVFEGQAMIQDGALYLAALNEHLSQLNGEIQFAGQTVAVQSLTGRLAGGHVIVSGEVRLQRFQLSDMRLSAEVTNLRLRYPAGFFASLDAEIVATGNSERQRITGEVALGQARYRQEFELASLLRQFRQRALEPPSMAEENLQFDIRVYTRDPLRLENRLAKLQLATDLTVHGSPNRPVVLGRVDIEKGTADVGGSRFERVSGSIDFLNPSRTEPFVDVAAETQKSGYQIHVMATGTPQQLDLRLTSEPALAEPDILSLLTVGATGQAITAGVGTVLPQRVSAFLTGQIAKEISQGVGGIVGIDRLDIEPVVGGAQRVGGPKVTVGKDVSKDLSVTYSTIVGSTLEDLVTIEYRLTDSISLLGVRNERGDVGVDVKFSLRFE